MVRRLSLAFAFFSVLTAVATPAFAAGGAACMYRCGMNTTATLQECAAVCGVTLNPT